MLSAGRRIRDAHDKLSHITTEYLYERIKQPSSEVESKLKALRLVYALDKKRYNELKRELPYVVCAVFTPEYRNTQNFASTDCFIVDIDHVGSQSMDISALKLQLCMDQRVVMAFVSPSGDGLKLLFALKEKCYDAGAFTAFYKAFVRQYALQYDLAGVIDSRTCDVCRACFVSHDRDVYYNPDAEPIDWKQVTPTSQYAEIKTETATTPVVAECDEAKPKETKEAKDGTKENPADPDKEIMDRIKQQLQLSRARERAKRDFYVPEEIETVMAGVREVIGSTGVRIAEERNIQYGKQLVLTGNLRRAELNIFFGRRGFSVVEQPRRGTSAEFNSLMGELVRDYLEMLSA